MRPSSLMWAVLWTVQMMIQAVEKGFMDPIKNTDKQLGPSNSVNRYQLTRISTPKSHTHKVYKQSAYQYWQ